MELIHPEASLLDKEEVKYNIIIIKKEEVNFSIQSHIGEVWLDS